MADLRLPSQSCSLAKGFWVSDQKSNLSWERGTQIKLSNRPPGAPGLTSEETEFIRLLQVVWECRRRGWRSGEKESHRGDHRRPRGRQADRRELVFENARKDKMHPIEEQLWLKKPTDHSVKIVVNWAYNCIREPRLVMEIEFHEDLLH